MGAPSIAARMAMFEKGKLVDIPEYEYKPFLKTKDAVMVLFYHSREPLGNEVRATAIQASNKANKANHAFVAVDCADKKKLCTSECISRMPTYKLFSRGTLVGTFERNLQKCDLVRLVEECPVFGVDFGKSVKSRIQDWGH
ncbi:hypothetical protein BsWGS_17026 [Bradybaena similaris]